MTEEISKRIKVIGFLMTCVIVMYHTGKPDFFVNEYDLKLNMMIAQVNDVLAGLAMSWFFTVSGFLLFRNLNKITYKFKVVRRINSLLIPYILWQMITVVKQLIQGDELNFQNIISNIFSLEPGHLMEHCGMSM